MDFREFEAFVQSNLDLLQGVHPESEGELAKYEAALGFPLPKSMKWLLSTHGYSLACGVEDLDGSVRTTEECRKNIQLPKNVLIINDWNDGGVVFAFADEQPDSEYEIIWGDAADLHQLSEGKPVHTGYERFKGFAEWVADRVQFERDNG
jgi:hypothetical protein